MVKRTTDDKPVALLSSHALLRDALRRTIDAQPGYKVVLMAAHGGELLKGLDAGITVGLVAVDLFLPHTDACSTIAVLRKRNTPVLALCAGADDASVRGAMDAGANGYVCHDGGECSLLQGLTEVYANRKYLDDLVNERFKKLDPERERIMKGLTDKRRELLRLVCKPGEWKWDELAMNMEISPNSLHTHRKALFKLFRVGTKLMLIRKAQEFGYHLGVCAGLVFI